MPESTFIRAENLHATKMHHFVRLKHQNRHNHHRVHQLHEIYFWLHLHGPAYAPFSLWIAVAILYSDGVPLAAQRQYWSLWNENKINLFYVSVKLKLGHGVMFLFMFVHNTSLSIISAVNIAFGC